MNQAAPRSLSPPVAPMAGRPWALRKPVSLSEVLDRVLNTGAVLSGELVISAAGVDLLYLGVNVLVSSVETLRGDGRPRERGHAAS